MAGKEATVYIVDVGSSMGEQNYGRNESDLDYAMRYIWDKITTTVSTGRKTLLAGVVAFRTDKTANDLANDDDSYNHISVLAPLEQITMPTMRKLRTQIVPSKTDEGDAISAIVLAVQMIVTVCKKLKYLRKIVLVTNGTGIMDPDDVSAIAKKLKEDDIQLVILGADFDNQEYGFQENGKDATKAENERTFKDLADQCGGVFGTLAQAVEELGIPRIKAVNPVASYRGHLTLGDPTVYESAMAIDVERFPVTMIARPPAASNFVIRSDMAPEQAIAGPSTAPQYDAPAENDGLAAIHNARTYQVKDEEAPGGKKDIAHEDLAKGYEYGRTAVHIAQSDENVTKLETKAMLSIVGFIPAASYPRYMGMERSHLIVPMRVNTKAIMAMESFSEALLELETYAVARLVPKDGKEPTLVLLAPCIEPGYTKCLYEVELPFAEDMRAYKFPPLDRILTISGKVLKEHRHLPSPALQDAMDEFVDQMDISKFEIDDEGNPAEYAQMENTFSPMLHRINQVIRHRAVHPDGEVPPPMDILVKYMNPPDELMAKVMPYVEKVRETADVKRVPPKSFNKKRGRGNRKEEKPRSNLDVAALLTARNKESGYKITADNAIPEFKQVLDDTGDIAVVENAVKQVGNIATELIKFSLGDDKYDRVVEIMQVMRTECIELETPNLYNEFARTLKEKMLSEQLNGDRREMWWKMKKMKLGLIDRKTSEQSDATEEDAQAFLTTK